MTPFPLLSDPDRSGIIEPWGLADPKDPRNLAIPAMVLLDTDGVERWRFVSRDYADRLPENEVLEVVRSLGLEGTSQARPTTRDPQPGPGVMPFEALWYYIRGARFAALALGRRHKDLDDSIKQDTKAYVGEMDVMLEAIGALREARSG